MSDETAAAIRAGVGADVGAGMRERVQPTQQEMWAKIPDPKRITEHAGRFIIEYGQHNVAQADTLFEAIEIAHINGYIADRANSEKRLGNARGAGLRISDAEVDRVLKEFERWRADSGGTAVLSVASVDLMALASDLQRARAELARVREVAIAGLEYYADEETYQDEWIDTSDDAYYCGKSIKEEEPGTKARAALAEIRGAE